MFTFLIYLGDCCIGDVNADSPDDAVNLYANRTNSSVYGLLAVRVFPLSSILTGSN